MINEDTERKTSNGNDYANCDDYNKNPSTNLTALVSNVNFIKNQLSLFN